MNDILLFSTSTRSKSYNTMLIKIIASLLSRYNINLISLDEYDMPMYNADFENSNGIPKNAISLHKHFSEALGVVISTAEYNGSYPPIVKNAIDWTSRVNLQCFYKKPVLIVSASPSAFGGIRAASMLKQLFITLDSIVMPSKFCVSLSDSAFDGNGSLKNPKLFTDLSILLDSFTSLVDRLKIPSSY